MARMLIPPRKVNKTPVLHSCTGPYLEAEDQVTQGAQFPPGYRLVAPYQIYVQDSELHVAAADSTLT